MTMTFRDEESRDLTPEEVDANFRHVLALIDNLLGQVPDPVELTGSILQDGYTIQFALSNSTYTDEVTLPVLRLNNRDVWLPSTVYNINDIVRIRGVGWYLVIEDHTSATAFDPNDPEYQFFMVDNTPSLPLEIDTTTLLVTRADHNFRWLRFTHADGCEVTFDDADWEDGDEVQFRSKTGNPIIFTESSAMSFAIPEGFDAAMSRREATCAVKFNEDEGTMEFAGLLDPTSV